MMQAEKKAIFMLKGQETYVKEFIDGHSPVSSRVKHRSMEQWQSDLVPDMQESKITKKQAMQMRPGPG